MGIYTLQSVSFPAILQIKSTAGDSLAVDFLLSCRKIFLFGVLCSFEPKVFSCRELRRVKKYLVYFKTDGGTCGEKDRFKTVSIPM